MILDAVRRPSGRFWLAGILGVAALARFWGIWFGLPNTQARPDERFVISTAVGFFSGDLHPHLLDYPTLFMYMLTALDGVYFLAGRLAGVFFSFPHFLAAWKSDWAPFYLIGRSASAVCGTVTVWIVFRLAARLFGVRCGLVSAAFLGLSFLHGRDSHFGVTDIAATCLACGSVLLLAGAHIDRVPQRFFAAGLLAGLAASTKYNTALLVAAILASQAIEIFEARRDRRGMFADRRLVLFLTPFVVAFLWGTPYVLLDVPRLLRSFERVTTHLQTGHVVDLGSGWTYHLTTSLRYAVGWPVLLMGLAGVVFAARQNPRMTLLLLAFPLACYAAAAPGRTVFIRYVIPIVPFLCVGAAVTCVAIAQGLVRVARLAPRWTPVVTATLTVVAILPSAVSLARFDYLIGRTDNRVLATKWMRDRLSSGMSVYQSDIGYGGLDLVGPGRVPIETWGFDETRGMFVFEGRDRPAGPDWIVLQRSQLSGYSRVPAPIEKMLEGPEYSRVRSFIAADLSASGNVFDEQDAFFLPIAGFNGVNRPGPNFDVYRRTRPARANQQ